MRVCVISGGYWPFVAGGELFCQQVAEHLARRGHEIHVVTGICNAMDPKRLSGLPPYRVENGVHVHRVKFIGVRYLQTMGLIRPITRKALELHQQKPFDLIHSHIFPGIFIGGVLAKRTGTPFLATLQGGDMADYPEMRIANWILKPMVRSGLRKADRVHAVSGSVAERAKELGGREIVQIPNAVDLAKFHPHERSQLRQQLGLDVSEKLVVTISRLSEKNAVDVLIRAFALVRARVAKVRLLIAGDGHQEGALRSLVKELALEESVKFLGYVHHAETAPYYAAADVFVRASRAEGFGISFIEAMASGTAVVGSTMGGIPDIITEGENGYMVRPEDVPALADRILHLITDDVARERVVSAGLKTVTEKFALESILNRMESLCLESAARKR